MLKTISKLISQILVIGQSICDMKTEKPPTLKIKCPWFLIRKAVWYVSNCRILRNIYFDFFSTYKTETAIRAKTDA